MDIDYRSYSLQELEDVAANIDQNLYPQRYCEIQQLIEEIRSSTSKSIEDQDYIEESQGLDSRKGCERIILFSFFAALFVTSTSFIVVLLAFTADFSGSLLVDEPVILVDIVISVVLTFFIYKKSRVASMLMLTYYSMSMFMVWFIDAEPSGIILGMVIIAALLSGTIATFRWHSSYVDEPVVELQN